MFNEIRGDNKAFLEDWKRILKFSNKNTDRKDGFQQVWWINYESTYKTGRIGIGHFNSNYVLPAVWLARSVSHIGTPEKILGLMLTCYIFFT